MIAGTYMSASLPELRSVGAHVGRLRDPDVKTLHYSVWKNFFPDDDKVSHLKSTEFQTLRAS